MVLGHTRTPDSIELLQYYLDRTHDLQTAVLVSTYCLGLKPHPYLNTKYHNISDRRIEDWCVACGGFS